MSDGGLFETHPAIYERMLDEFLEKGVYDEEDNPDFEQDPLYIYIVSQMRDPWLRLRVLSDKVQAAVFRNITLDFIFQQYKILTMQRKMNQSVQQKIQDAANWDCNKRQTEWKTLLQEVEERIPGFTNFYQRKFQQMETLNDDLLWQHFLDRWKQAELEKIEMTCKSTTEAQSMSVANQTRKSMEDVEHYVCRNQVRDSEFLQAWSAMSGIWNSVIYERLQKLIRMQNRYPILEELASKMGRVADEESNQRLLVSSVRTSQLSHATKSDVYGVTVGDDLNSMLPLEMVQSADEEMSDLFLYKYVTKRLQTFSHRSEVNKPIHHLRMQSAKRMGPMIVCLDTSGSMAGEPEKVSNSLLLRLLEMADRQKRGLYLLPFASMVYPIDVKRERSRMFDFFKQRASGDTNARPMMQKMFELLDANAEYMSSDVLWITDFKIPMVEKLLIEKMKESKLSGTRYYALQIGLSDNEKWDSLFDEKYVLRSKI